MQITDVKPIKGKVFTLSTLKKKQDNSEFVVMTIRSEQNGKTVWYRAALPDGTKDLFKIGDIVCASGPLSPDPYSPHDSFNLRTDLRKILKISEAQLADPNYPPPEPEPTKFIPGDMMEVTEGYYYLERVDDVAYFKRFENSYIGVYVDPITKYHYSFGLHVGSLVQKKNFKGTHLQKDTNMKDLIIEQNKKLEDLLKRAKQLVEDDEEIPF